MTCAIRRIRGQRPQMLRWPSSEPAQSPAQRANERACAGRSGFFRTGRPARPLERAHSFVTVAAQQVACRSFAGNRCASGGAGQRSGWRADRRVGIGADQVRQPDLVPQDGDCLRFRSDAAAWRDSPGSLGIESSYNQLDIALKNPERVEVVAEPVERGGRPRFGSSTTRTGRPAPFSFDAGGDDDGIATLARHRTGRAGIIRIRRWSSRTAKEHAGIASAEVCGSAGARWRRWRRILRTSEGSSC